MRVLANRSDLLRRQRGGLESWLDNTVLRAGKTVPSAAAWVRAVPFRLPHVKLRMIGYFWEPPRLLRR